MIGRLLQWSSEALKSKTLHNWAERFSVNVETLEPVLCSLSSGALLRNVEIHVWWVDFPRGGDSPTSNAKAKGPVCRLGLLLYLM
ncbi:hypothetical protein ACSSQ8_001672, partial [Cronobacter sakazakii]